MVELKDFVDAVGLETLKIGRINDDV